MKQRPIEIDFPIEQVNEIAEREAHAKGKYRPIYFIHKWWARKLGSVFRTIVLYSLLDEKARVLEDDGSWRPVTKEELENPWLLYLKDVDLGGKIVLDPMMGGGTTVEALRLGCKVVAQDLNPVAWFLVKKMVEPACLSAGRRQVDIDLLKEGFKKLEERIADEIKQYYRTICPHCLKRYCENVKKSPDAVIEEVVRKLGKNSEPKELYEKYHFEDAGSYEVTTGQRQFPKTKNIFADTMYYFWIKEVPCLNCSAKVPLFRGYMLAKKRGKQEGYHVICPDCGNIFDVKDYRKDTRCPDCGRKFNPDKDGNVQGKYYICPECGQKSVIIEAIQRRGKPEERLYAVEYYCPSCNQKEYKQADEFDQALFDKARGEYKKVEPEWLGRYVPETKIPEGVATKEPLNHGYIYWKDMFNERQLLSLGRLLKAILELDVDLSASRTPACPRDAGRRQADENVRELLVITLSDTLNYQNMLCEYNRVANKLKELFSKHAFHSSTNPVENNVWGSSFGRGIFHHVAEKIIQSKNYNDNPFEKYINSGKTLERPSKVKIQGKICDLFNSDGNIQLSCGGSSYLPIPDNSIDAIITDPPYCGYVMYSELSEFYYAWLRLALKNKYEYFQSEHVPNTAEVIVNKEQGKDEKDFIEGLTAIFKEAGRKLKNDGIMVFTFHHQEEKAWGAVLRSVLNAGFYIASIYPVQSEPRGSPHIFQKASIRHDMVIVRRKKETRPERKHWCNAQVGLPACLRPADRQASRGQAGLSASTCAVGTADRCNAQAGDRYCNYNIK